MVSVTTYRDAGFLPQAYINFLCLLGWSPKDDREKMTRQELMDAFTLEGVNRSNAVVNFTDEDPDRSEGGVAELRAHPRAAGRRNWPRRLLPFVQGAGFDVDPEKMLRITPLIQERIKTPARRR